MCKRIVSMVLSCVAVLWAMPAAAFVVDSNSDMPDLSLDGVCDAGGVCTLRAAMMEAHFSPGPHTVELVHPGPYFLTIPTAGGADIPASGDLDVVNDVIVQAVGAPRVVLSAGTHNDRFFDVKPGATLSIVNVAMQNGGGATTYRGGAVAVEDASLFVEDGHFIGNKAVWWGGAIHGHGTSMISVVRTRFLNNEHTNISSLNGGGAIAIGSALVSGSSTVVASDCLFSGNHAYEGGAIWSRTGGGAVFVGGSSFDNNTSTWVGGAISVWEPPTPTQIVHSDFISNSADQGGAIHLRGDAAIEDAFFEDNSATTGGAIFHTHTTATHLQLDTSWFRNNVAGVSAGAIEVYGLGGHVGTTQITDSLFEDNSASYGGAIRVTFTDMEVRTSEFHHNSASELGGAFQIDGAGWKQQGPKNVFVFTGESTKFVDSWIHDNSATGGLAIGGGVAVDGAELVLLRTTLSENVADNSAGAASVRNGKLRATNTTVSNNHSPTVGGIELQLRTQGEVNYSTIFGNDGKGLSLVPSAGVTIARLRGTILAGNVTDCSFATPNNIISMDHNFWGALDPGCAISVRITDQAGTTSAPISPMLSPLSVFAGVLPPAHMPMTSSPVLDAAESGACTGVTVASVWQDQRLAPRPFNIIPLPGPARCDIGSVERRISDGE